MLPILVGVATCCMENRSGLVQAVEHGVERNLFVYVCMIIL